MSIWERGRGEGGNGSVAGRPPSTEQVTTSCTKTPPAGRPSPGSGHWAFGLPDDQDGRGGVWGGPGWGETGVGTWPAWIQSIDTHYPSPNTRRSLPCGFKSKALLLVVEVLGLKTREWVFSSLLSRVLVGS